MKEIQASVLTVCVLLVAVEVISRIAPPNKMIGFVRSLIITLLLVSAVSTWAGSDFQIDFADTSAAENDELQEYVNEQYENTVQEQMADYIAGLLETIQIENNKIEVFTDINESGSILIEKVRVVIRYENDRERAAALLKNTLGDELKVEVTANGS